MNYYRMNPRLKKSGGGNKTMTVILDLTNSDPTQWASYADDAIGMVAGSDAWDEFFGHYPCILENGVELGKLKRDNFAQYEDGTSAPITMLGKDVMICFPKRGIKLEYLDANTLSVSMTNEEGKTGYSYMAHSYKGNDISKFYLGAYKGYVSSNNLYSTSGQTPTGNVTIGNFRTYAQARGTGYEQSAFFQLTFRQVMYLLKYKGQNPQIAIGRGFVDGNSSAHATGGTNTRGMDWGESTGTDQMKLFGLEDFYGNVYEWIDGIWSNANRQIYVADGNFNDTGSNYTSAGTSSSSSNITGYMRYPNGTNLAGFTLSTNSNKGTDSTYFCASADVDASRLASFGGYWYAASYAGVFRLGVSRTASAAIASVGGRLMFMRS